MMTTKQRIEKLEKQSKPEVKLTWKEFISMDDETSVRYDAELKARGEMTWAEFIAGKDLEGIGNVNQKTNNKKT
jgi:hypothetical protein